MFRARKKPRRLEYTVEYASGQVCAARHREPCQAGNRAALSGSFCVPQSACTLMLRNFFVTSIIQCFNGGDRYLYSFIQKMAAAVL